MTIKVIGMAHLKGVSKRTGNNYDFVQLHFIGPARNVEGMAAQTVSVNPDIADDAEVAVGKSYDLDFDQRGFCVDIRPAVVPVK